MVIGGTGSGKTSPGESDPRFLSGDKGEILLEGRDIRTMSDEELRGRIGVVPQKAVLFKERSAATSSGASQRYRSGDVELIELAQASEVVDGKPGKLDATVAQNGKNFSGG